MTQPGDFNHNVVDDMLARLPSANRKETRSILGFFAALTRNGMLPESGRQYVADVLDALADDDAAAILPQERKPRGPSNLQVMVATEREREKRGGIYGVYEALGPRFGSSKTAKGADGLTPGTVKKMASLGRTHVRSVIRENIERGADRSTLIRTMAEILGISSGALERILASKKT